MKSSKFISCKQSKDNENEDELSNIKILKHKLKQMLDT